MHFLEVRMTIVEKFKQYPLVLWALALYLCSLGFNLKYDIPLVVLVVATTWTISCSHRDFQLSEIFFQYWHVIVFLILTFLITLVSEKVSYSFLAQVQFIPGLLVYCAIVTAVDDRQSFRSVYFVVIMAGLITGVVFLCQVVLIENADMMSRVKSTQNPLFIVPNDVLLLTIISPLALGFLASEQRGLLGLLAVCCVVCACLATIYVQSRQAAGIFAFSMFGFFFLWRPLWGVVVGVLVLFVVLAIDLLMGGGLVHKIHLFPRTYIWHAAWEMFLDSPTMGQGPGLFKQYYYEYLERAGYSLDAVEDRRLMNWAHSLYLEQLAERGLLGFFALFVLVGRPLAGLVRRSSWHWVSNHEQKKVVRSFIVGNGGYLAGLIVAYVAFLLGGIAEASLLRLWVVMTLFIITGLADALLFSSKK